MVSKRVIVIGAGPSGLAAALSALKEGASVVVLEHMSEAGKKLLLTGKGQCNLSNTQISPDHYHGGRELVSGALSRFGLKDLESLMEEIGVTITVEHYRHEACGYCYPSDHKALSVRDGFVKRIEEEGGRILTGVRITDIEKSEDATFFIRTEEKTFHCDSIVFATGANAYPETGSDSSIYPVLKKLGIHLKTWMPALVALKSNAQELRLLKGLRADGTVTLTDETKGMSLGTFKGEIQFREHYISGLPVLQLSRHVAPGIKEGHSFRLDTELLHANNKDGTLPFGKVSFHITGTEGFDRAQCCSGGVEEKELDPSTFESLKIPGIYFAGELTDVDGECGGFNLHYAFATGVIAGRNAAK